MMWNNWFQRKIAFKFNLYATYRYVEILEGFLVHQRQQQQQQQLTQQQQQQQPQLQLTPQQLQAQQLLWRGAVQVESS
jgi:hypothetical protein